MAGIKDFSCDLLQGIRVKTEAVLHASLQDSKNLFCDGIFIVVIRDLLIVLAPLGDLIRYGASGILHGEELAGHRERRRIRNFLGIEEPQKAFLLLPADIKDNFHGSDIPLFVLYLFQHTAGKNGDYLVTFEKAHEKAARNFRAAFGSFSFFFSGKPASGLPFS